MLRSAFAALSILALSGCLFGGGGTDTETLEIHGRVQPEGGQSFSARVKLIPADFEPGISDPAEIRVAQTGASGEFRFRSLEKGRYYNIVASVPERRLAFAESLRAGGLGPFMMLSPARTYFLALQGPDSLPPDSGVAYFPGTDILARCDGVNATRVDSIPAGLRRFAARGHSGWKTEAVLDLEADSLFITASQEGVTVGGDSAWRPLASGTTQNLYALDFISADTGWAVGEQGIILKTLDGGASWFEQNSGTPKDLNAVQFLGPLVGFAAGGDTAGGVLLATSDGGATWVAVAAGAAAPALHALHFPTSDAGFAVGENGALLRFAGSTWIPAASPTPAALYGVFFLDADTGYAVGAGGTLLKTRDGGANWAQQNPGTGAFLYGVHFSLHLYGMAVGSGGALLKTADSGANWALQPSGTTLRLNAVRFLDILTGYAVGDGGTVLRSTDGGVTWRPQPAGGVSAQLMAIDFPAPGLGYACGMNGTILKMGGR